MKSNLFAYLIFVHESKDDALSVDAYNQQEFLKTFNECFADELPQEVLLCVERMITRLISYLEPHHPIDLLIKYLMLNKRRF